MALLEVRNLRKNFGQTDVLRGVSFDLEKGEVLTLIGSSGGGKTTLLRCINFLEIPSGGSITVNGEELYESHHTDTLSEAQLRKNRLHFGLVFQGFNLFPQYTVLQNITLAMNLRDKNNAKAEGIKFNKEAVHNFNRAYAEELLSKVGLLSKKDSYPYQLSGGQSQRVAIARALAMKPDILCFDEPTSALDPELTGEVLKVIRELKSADTTMIIVTHEMDFARSVSDRVIFMADGVIEENGPPEKLFVNPESKRLQEFLARSLMPL